MSVKLTRLRQRLSIVFLSTEVKNTAIYVASNILNASVPFLMLPVLTRALSIEDYGRIALYYSALTILPAIVGLNSAGAANRAYFDDGRSSSQMAEYVTACLAVTLGTALFCLCLISLADTSLQRFTGIDAFDLTGATIATCAIVLVQIRLGQYMVREQAARYAFLQLFTTTSNVGVSLYLVLIVGSGADGRIIGHVLGVALAGILALAFLHRDRLLLVKLPGAEVVRSVLSFGVPLVPHALGGGIFVAYDRVAIASTLGVESAGIYLVYVQLAAVIALLSDSINKVYAPWLFKQLGSLNPKIGADIVRYSYLVMFALLLLPFVIGGLGDHLVGFFAGEKYIYGGNIFFYLILGNCLNSSYLIFVAYVFYERKTGALSSITIAAGGLQIFLLFLLIPKTGLEGAALSFAISSGLRLLATAALANYVFPMPWLSAPFKRA